MTGLTASLTARHTAVVGALRSAASPVSSGRSAVSSSTVTPLLKPRTSRKTTTAPASTSQNRPDRLSWRGSGGGSPDGRRRREARAGAWVGARGAAVSPAATGSGGGTAAPLPGKRGGGCSPAPGPPPQP